MAIPAMAVSAMADFVSFVLRRDVGSLLVPCCHDRQRKQNLTHGSAAATTPRIRHRLQDDAENLLRADRSHWFPHFGPAVEPLLVAMAIRENDGDGKPPMKVSDLVKRLKMPRSNVRRALAKLLDDGMIHERNDSSYVGSIDYLAARIDAEYFIEIKKAVHAASAALKALET
jgi:DNA-binding transcriptional ArsR family regulator